MSNNNSKSDLKHKFTIDNNIIKGIKKTYDVKEKNIGEVILKIFDQNPDHVAQIETETGLQTTFAEMKEQSIRCALWMQEQGIKSGDVVGLCTHNRMDTYVPFIATFLVGAVQNPWCHEITLSSARHFMNLTEPKLMFACESVIDTLAKAAKLENKDVKFIVFGKHHLAESLTDITNSKTKQDVCNFQMREISPSDIALILFSSGTTGHPKAVQHSYETLLLNVSHNLYLDIKDMVYMWYSTLYWISGVLAQLQLIMTVSTRILHEKFDPEETCKCIEKYKVNFIIFTSVMLSYLCKTNVLKKYDLSSLKLAATGGSKVSLEILQEFKNGAGMSATQIYGMTELGAAIAMQSSECESIESVGFVVPNIDIKIIDLTTKKALGPNKPGEICIKSASKMIGYLKNSAATKEIIDDEDWLHTGDIGYYSKDGEFFIVDRIKEVMKVSGHHVSPSEIEEALLGHPAVMEVIVVSVPDKVYTDKPIAFVKKNPEMKVTEDELIKISSDLGVYKTLSRIRFLDELPHTASGKMNRKEAKEMAKVYAE